MQEPSLPFRLGEYVVFDRIGKGGMAEIFLARRSGSLAEGRKVVLKKILPYLARIPSFVNVLMDEARYMEKLRSPFVTQIVDFESHGENVYISMEYVEGLDLNRLMGLFSKRRIPVPVPFVFHVMSCVLQGLHSVHEASDDQGKPLNLIHLDLSPGNVLVSFSGEVKICDFGVATTSELTKILAKEGEIRGKLSYMSPEQAAGAPLDRKSDIFSAGIILWELLSGRRMYSSDDKNKVHEMAVEGRYPPLERGRFQDQEKIEAVLARALGKKPEDRYSTALEFFDDIMDYVHGRKIVLSQLSIGSMIEELFSEEILEVRNERERALTAILPVES